MKNSVYKIIYRRYAGLFFSICVDVNDNELAYLERFARGRKPTPGASATPPHPAPRPSVPSIHLFVEMLDLYFGNVCELDLVFNFHKVRPHTRVHRASARPRSLP